ncbi:MAG: DUF5103 domain-containing protein [Chitinophagales bacterium]|nr:DUF5103 domain-containing protein [Chitinophagales bacterium]
MNNKVFVDNIKTVRLYPDKNEVGMPLIELSSNDKLLFSFDELGLDSKTYYYTVVQCNYDWTVNDQDTYTYIDGFSRATIDDYDYSFNTLTHYVHYKLEFPNLDMKPKQSGNYALVVYEDTPENPVITTRFVVIENIVAVTPRVQLPNNRINYRNYQEIDYDIQYKGLTIQMPQQEIMTSVLQNQRWDNAFIGIKPRFQRPGLLEFDYNGQIAFEAGREYRRFDTRSIRFLGYGTRALDGNDVYLLYDKTRKYDKYFIETDYNGQYYTDVLEYPNRDLEADYANVHFNYITDGPVVNAKLYVGGIFNNYDATQENQLKWNPNDGIYETTIQLKQGFYDYLYYTVNDKDDSKSISETEGNDYDAENQYDIFVYYRSFGERYDRVIGYVSFNSKTQ